MRNYVRLMPVMALGLAALTPVAWAEDTLPASNPFAAASTLPFQAPPYDRIHDADFQPAIEAGIAQELAEYRAIADNPAPPDFDNTIRAMEQAGELRQRVTVIFQNLVSANTNDTLQKINETESPHLQALEDAELLDAKLFQRVRTLYESRDKLGLTPDQKFLLVRHYTKFIRAGAALPDADKAKLRDINGQLATMATKFQATLLKATDDGAVLVEDRAELDGLSDGAIAAAAEAAKARHLDGKYLIALQNTTQQPILASLKNRALRLRILAASEARGDHDGPTDLRDLIATMAQLRAQRAALLGFPSFAAFTLDDQMAKSPAIAKKLLAALVPAATKRAKAEAAEIQALIDRQKGGFKLTAADWEFYAEQVRKTKYAIDGDEVKQYFELDHVLKDGVFFAAEQLYGITFKPRTDIPVYQPDVRVYEVFDADGKSLALFYADYFARPNKNGGAWCSYLNNPSGLSGQKPVIVNVANFSHPVEGQPALLSSNDVRAMFHEFGHALHAMFSVQYFPSEDGFNSPIDVIEFPSQFNEHWAMDPTVLNHYAHHYQTGAVIPPALVEKLRRASKYGEGYALTELVAAALLDLDWHSLPASAPKQHADAFETKSLTVDHIALPQVPPRYRSTYFLHIWGDGYAANYYSYLWGEIIDDDAFEWFTEHGGLTRANGQHFRDTMFTPGYTDNPMVLYRNFRGRDPSAEALKRERGLD